MGTSVAAFRLRFATNDDAAEFLQAQQGWLDAAGATGSNENGATIYEANTGKVTAVAPQNGQEVLFTIGSTKDAASKAIQALLKG
jgi:hypothetical protein